MMKRRDFLYELGGMAAAVQLPDLTADLLSRLPASYGIQASEEMKDAYAMNSYIDALDSGYHWQKIDSGDHTRFIFTYGWGSESKEAVTTDRDALSASCRPVLRRLSGTIHESEPTEEQKCGIRRAMAELERIANVQFLEFTPGMQTNIYANKPDRPLILFKKGNLHNVGVGALSYYPHDDGIEILVSEEEMRGDLHDGSAAFRALLHELGHGAGGLKHPTDSRPYTTATLAPRLANQNFAIMSDYPSTPASLGGEIASRTDDGTVPCTYMTLDIAALQRFLGANWKYNAENKPYAITGKSKIWTVWNGEQPGIFDARAYPGMHTTYINLNPGPVGNPTHVGDEYIWIAHGTVMDKAFGALNASNRCVGNAKGGSRFVGGQLSDCFELSGRGNEVDTGGSGANRFLLHPGAQASITGFRCDKDTICLAGSAAVSRPSMRLNNGDALMSFASPAGDVEITLIRFQGDPARITYAANGVAGMADTRPSPWAARAARNHDVNNPLACKAR